MSPELPHARIDRQWSAVQDGLAKAPSRPRRGAVVIGGALAGGLAVAAAVALFLLAGGSPERAPLTEAGDAPEAPSPEPVEVTEHVLSDGSEMVLSAATRVRTVRDAPEAVTLELSEGRGVFDVTRRPERRFTVSSGDVDVVVIGTRFSVTREGDTVEVEVERGRVEVHRGGEVSVLGAGERWSGPAHQPEPTVEASTRVETRRRRRAPSRPAGSERTETDPVEIERGRALFEAAQAARRARDPRRAAQLFGQLVREHPRDPRAGLAAYELGRLRLDVLHDARGAAPAFERALALGVHAELRESVRAHLVRAYDETQSPRCASARAHFLAAYPRGSLADDVRGRCGGD